MASIVLRPSSSTLNPDPANLVVAAGPATLITIEPAIRIFGFNPVRYAILDPCG